MKTNRWTRSVAAATLLAISASSAVAGTIEVAGAAGENVPNSWVLPLSINVNAGTTGSPEFDNIKLYALAGTTFTTTNGTFTVSDQLFEDVTGVSGHRAIEDFSHYGPGGSLGTDSWAQTSPAAGSGSVSEVFASGGKVSAGSYNHLDFNLYFDGDIEDGVHFRIEFWDATTFQTGYDVKYILRDGQTSPDSEYAPTYAPLVNVVPLPAAAWMGLVMLGGLGLIRNRRRRNVRRSA